MRPLNQDQEELNLETPNIKGNGTENSADEANILTDQDETLLANPNDNDPNIGSDGTPEVGAEGGAEFERGEIDVKEAMDRTQRNMDLINHH
jgi:hypothetical protein